MSIAFHYATEIFSYCEIVNMKTTDEIRRSHLIQIAEKMGSIANLNRALDRKPRDATINQIINGAVDSKTGKQKHMGLELARDIEIRLSLERGYLDTDPSLCEWPFLSFSYADFCKLSTSQKAVIEEALGKYMSVFINDRLKD